MKGIIWIWLSVLTVSVIIIVVAIVSGCIKYDNIHIEGYISILSTLIGVLVTFAVGYQIVNTIEIKNEQKRIISQQEEAYKKLEEIKEYADKTEKVSELLKKQTLLNNSKDEPSKLLLQLDCIKLCIDLNWEEDNYGMEMLKPYFNYMTCLNFSHFRSMKDYSIHETNPIAFINFFRNEYIQKIKDVGNTAAKYSLTTQIKQLYLFEQCLNIQLKSIVKNASLPYTLINLSEKDIKSFSLLLNEYDKLAQL